MKDSGASCSTPSRASAWKWSGRTARRRMSKEPLPATVSTWCRPGRKLGLNERGMICIGNQTACWAATAVEPFDYAVAQGFNAFEWFPDKKPGAGWDENDLDPEARQRIRDIGQA